MAAADSFSFLLGAVVVADRFPDSKADQRKPACGRGTDNDQIEFLALLGLWIQIIPTQEIAIPLVIDNQKRTCDQKSDDN